MRRTTTFALLTLAGLLMVGCQPAARFKPNVDYPHLRVLSTTDIDLLEDHHATFDIIYPMSFGAGQPWTQFETREAFEGRIAELKSLTTEAHDNGITVIAYISKTFNSHTHADVDSLGILKVYNSGRWDEYGDYFGPKPPETPKEWIEVRADGSLGGYTWVNPSGGPLDFEKFTCANNPYTRQYLKGMVKMLGDMGIDGFYLDHTEGEGCYCKYCDAGFREHIQSDYPTEYLQDRYDMTRVADLVLPTSSSDPLWSEWKKFASKSQVDLHRHLLEEGRKFNPNFIVSGNLFGAGGFGFAALNGSDIEMIGDVDVILYSEIVPSTESSEQAQLTIPGYREGTRISNSPLYKHMVAAHGEGPILVYPLYPESPNPVPKESALYNIVRLVTAEAAANHASMRRLTGSHSQYVRDAIRDIYTLIEANEQAMSGAKMYTNVAVLTSLNQVYHGEYALMYSASRALSDAGVSHTMLTEKDLSKDLLGKYEVLVVPHLPLLSMDTEAVIEAFLENGGGVVVIGASGVRDRHGRAKETPLFARLLNTDLTSPPDEAVRREIGSGRLVYLPVSQASLNDIRSLVRDFTNSEAGVYGKSLQQHKVFGWGQYPPEMLSTWRQLPDAVRWVTDEGLAGIIKTPAVAELTLMRSPDGKRLFAHVVNYQVGLNGSVHPLEISSITLRLPEKASVRNVLYASTTAPEPRHLDFQAYQQNDHTYIDIPINDLEIYGIATIELK